MGLYNYLWSECADVWMDVICVTQACAFWCCLSLSVPWLHLWTAAGCLWDVCACGNACLSVLVAVFVLLYVCSFLSKSL